MVLLVGCDTNSLRKDRALTAVPGDVALYGRTCLLGCNPRSIKRLIHLGTSVGPGLCQPPDEAMIVRARFGPQLPRV